MCTCICIDKEVGCCILYCFTILKIPQIESMLTNIVSFPFNTYRGLLTKKCEAIIHVIPFFIGTCIYRHYIRFFFRMKVRGCAFTEIIHKHLSYIEIPCVCITYYIYSRHGFRFFSKEGRGVRLR